MATAQLESAKAPNERTDWAYSMTLEPENKGGTPTTIVIGKPKIKESYAYILPDDIAKNDHMYELKVAMNIIHGDKRIECLATCVVSGKIGGDTFELKQFMPTGNSQMKTQPSSQPYTNALLQGKQRMSALKLKWKRSAEIFVKKSE